MGRNRISDAEYLARYRTDADGCWIWTGGGFGRYGSAGMETRPDGRRVARAAHRLSYQHHIGPIPEGMHVLHRCDKPRCIRPECLFLGTHSDNMADKKAKGRAPKSHRRKLTFEQAEAIRADSRSSRAISAEYGVSKTSILAIKRGHAYSSS